VDARPRRRRLQYRLRGKETINGDLRLPGRTGLRDRQLVGGTIIWRQSEGHTYVTTPGSALLFPSLCF